MDFLKQWTLCFCTSLTVAVILSLFTPKGTMKGFYRLLISVFVFISFLYPLKDFGGLNIQSYGFNEEQFQSEGDKAYEHYLNNQIRALLEENGVIGSDVSSSVTLSSNATEAVINGVYVSVPEEYDVNIIKKLIFEKAGITAEVKHIGE